MRGFELVPLDGAPQADSGWELAPIEPERPSTLRNVALNNPLTAIGETALNLASTGVAMPVAGLAGLATEAARSVGLTDRSGADVVHDVAGAMTYQPRGEMGQAATQAVMYPFEKLNEAATWAGDKTMAATGSPTAATAVHTAIEGVLPMAVFPAARAGRAALREAESPKVKVARGLLNFHSDPSPTVLQRLMRLPEEEAVALFENWQAKNLTKEGRPNVDTPASPVPGGVQHLGMDAATLPESAQPRLEALRRPGDNDLPAMEQVRGVSERRWPETEEGALAGALGREWELHPGELPLAGTEIPGGQSTGLLQGGTGRGVAEYRRSGEAPGDLPEHVSASLAEAENARSAGVLAADDTARRPDIADLSGPDAEYRGMGTGSRDTSGNASHEAIRVRDWDAGSADPRQTAADSLARAERILNERGSIAGFIDHYNRHVNDGSTVESFTQHPDGAHSLRVVDGRGTRTVRITPDSLNRYLDVLRDPAKVAEIEARNQGDVVLGRSVRQIDDATLYRWADMSSMAPAARAKVAREISRREAGRLNSEIDAKANEAATSPLNDKPLPTAAQIEAGTYAKGHLNLHGLDIAIENPKGSIRKGMDASGRQWETHMENHYGYIKRSQARDGDHVDVFIGDKPESPKAFVIDQIDPKTGKYDEPKVILGAADAAEAQRVYHANYEQGWKGMGAMSEMPVDQFREWVRSGETKKPVALPKIAGRHVTEFDDAALQRFINGKQASDAAKAKARAELERRTASADFSEATPETQAMAAEAQNGTWNPGANYAPFVDQMRAPEAKATSVADLPAPIRRETIIKDFADALGATVYEGRVKGKNRLGFFRPKNEETRIKNAADIEVAAHEMAHLIDSRVPELSKAWRSDTALREELKSVSYDQKSVPEGFAEGVRLWMTQPETLEARAPKVAAWLDDFASGNKEYGPAMKKAQERMTAWFGQDALNRARSKIGTETPLAEHFDRAFDKFRQSTVDDLHGIMQMERDLTGKLSPVGPYESARLSRASASIADGAVRFGHPVKQADGSFKFAGKGLEEILQPVAKNLDDALLYFVGRSANELMAQGREHLFTKGEIDAMLKLKTPERDAAFAAYQNWNKGILDFAEAQGILNGETRRLWNRTQYLPFHRVEQPGGIKGKPGDWAGVQALTGGTTNLRDILGNMIGNAAMLLDKAVKNEARLKVADLAESTKAGKFMVKIEAGERSVKIGGDQVLDAMFKRYGIAVDGDAPAFFQFMLKGQPPAGNNVVAVLRGGKPTWYEVGDPILYRSLLAIDRPVQNWLVRMLGAPKRIGQASITLTPDFWLANMARDTLMGSVMSRAGFWPILDSLQGMRLRMTNDPIYREFIANGGGLSSIFLDEGALRSKLKRFYQRQGIDYRTVLDTPEKLLNAVETLGDAFEMSTRLGEYRRAIQRGEHPRHAAYLGREVSTDFAMRGDSKTLGFLYDTVMFLKAATVSWDRLGRGVTIDPNKGAIAAKTAAIAGVTAALYLLNKDRPEFQDMEPWKRDAYWHFYIPGIDGQTHHFMMPRIWEIGSVASMAERSTEKLMAGNPEGLGKDFARILGNTFHLNLMPQIIAPLYEQATNRNSFTTAPIETPGMEGVQPFLRSKPGTSETFKALGMATKDNPEWAQVNPARAEALLRGYLNTWGLYGLMLTDQAFFGDKLPEKRADELPVVRRFYASEPAKHTKYESEFYDLLNEARRLRGTMRELDELGMREVADSKEKIPLAGEAKPLERAQKNLGAINRDMQAIRRDPILTPAEKRQKLDALTVERNALLKEAVLESKAAQKENEP